MTAAGVMGCFALLNYLSYNITSYIDCKWRQDDYPIAYRSWFYYYLANLHRLTREILCQKVK